MNDDVSVSEIIDPQMSNGFGKLADKNVMLSDVKNAFGITYDWETLKTDIDSKKLWKLDLGFIARVLKSKTSLFDAISCTSGEFEATYLDKYWDVIKSFAKFTNLGDGAVEDTLEYIVLLLDHINGASEVDPVRLRSVLNTWDLDLKEAVTNIQYIVRSFLDPEEEVTLAELIEEMELPDGIVTPLLELFKMLGVQDGAVDMSVIFDVVGILYDWCLQMTKGMLGEIFRPMILEPVNLVLRLFDLGERSLENRLKAAMNFIEDLDDSLVQEIFGSRDAANAASERYKAIRSDGIDLCALVQSMFPSLERNTVTTIMEILTTFFNEDLTHGFDSLRSKLKIDVKKMLELVISGDATLADITAVFGFEDEIRNALDHVKRNGEQGSSEPESLTLVQKIAVICKDLYDHRSEKFDAFGITVDGGTRDGLNKIPYSFAEAVGLSGFSKERNVRFMCASFGKFLLNVTQVMQAKLHWAGILKPVAGEIVGRLANLSTVLLKSDPVLSEIVDAVFPGTGISIATMLKNMGNAIYAGENIEHVLRKAGNVAFLNLWATVERVGTYSVDPKYMTPHDLVNCFTFGLDPNAGGSVIRGGSNIYSIIPINELVVLGKRCSGSGFSEITFRQLEGFGMSWISYARQIAREINGTMNMTLVQVLDDVVGKEVWEFPILQLGNLTYKASIGLNITCSDINVAGAAIITAIREVVGLPVGISGATVVVIVICSVIGLPGIAGIVMGVIIYRNRPVIHAEEEEEESWEEEEEECDFYV